MAISKIENNSLASGVPSTAKLPAGTVLQVVSSVYTTYPTTTTSTSFVTTGHTVSITPTSANSKILLIAGTSTATTGSGNTGYFSFARNGTNIGNSTKGFVEQGSGFWAVTEFHYLDSPATTSPITYSVYFKNSGGATTYWVGDTGESAMFTAMEIAA